MIKISLKTITFTYFDAVAPVIGSVRGCVEPCIRSMLSKSVHKDKKGRDNICIAIFNAIPVIPKKPLLAD